jgi:hypothetical protein
VTVTVEKHIGTYKYILVSVFTYVHVRINE